MSERGPLHRRRPLELEPHYVYWLFDASGALLYVGATVNVRQRLAEHRRRQHWWPQVVDVHVTETPNRNAAFELECEILRIHAPAWTASSQQRGAAQRARKVYGYGGQRRRPEEVAA
jgi:predicted GIY-YIG superfamily endonuclease